MLRRDLIVQSAKLLVRLIPEIHLFEVGVMDWMR